MVETSIGPASETELIRDNQNNIATTLETYLFTYGKTDEIKIALDEFELWLRSSLVLTKNIIPHNIVMGYENEKNSSKDNRWSRLKILSTTYSG